jgi:hypothetical protein
VRRGLKRPEHGDFKSATGGEFRTLKGVIGERPARAAWSPVHHAAAVSLYVAHYNLCRVHEALRATPAVALGVADRVWTIGDLIDAVLPLEPNRPIPG